MKTLVTGAAGFIGSHLSERLLAGGGQVVGLDNFDNFYRPAIKKTNIAECLANSSFRLIQGDIRNAKCIKKILADGVDTIIHLAAKAGVRPSIKEPLEYYDVNVNGTVVLLEEAQKAGIKKFIFASSSSVYGNNEKTPFSETDCVDLPISPYAASKKAAELACHACHHLHGIDIICLRLFTVYGPRQRPDLAIHKFAKLIEANKPIPVYGDGSMKRDFTYIDDVIDGIVSAIKNCNGYDIYNIGNCRPVSVNQLINALEEALGKKAIIERLPPQAGDVKTTWADITKAGRKLAFKPRVDMKTGLARFVEWFRTSAEGTH